MSIVIQASVALALALGAFMAGPASLHSSASSDANAHVSVPAQASVDSHEKAAADTSLSAQGDAHLTDGVSIGL